MSMYYLAILSPLTSLGVFLVLWIISLFLVMVWMSRKVRGRTVREFVSTENIWPTIDTWAAQTGYKLVEQDQASRLYQRGTGFLVAPQMVKLTAMSGFYSIEAWVRMTKFNKVITFGLVPEESVVDQGGLWGCIPRSRARKDVNSLLHSLGALPVSKQPSQTKGEHGEG